MGSGGYLRPDQFLDHLTVIITLPNVRVDLYVWTYVLCSCLSIISCFWTNKLLLTILLGQIEKQQQVFLKRHVYLIHENIPPFPHSCGKAKFYCNSRFQNMATRLDISSANTICDRNSATRTKRDRRIRFGVNFRQYNFLSVNRFILLVAIISLFFRPKLDLNFL